MSNLSLLFLLIAGRWIRQAHIGQLVRRRNLQADAATDAIRFSTSQSLHGERPFRGVESSSFPAIGSNGRHGTAAPADATKSLRTTVAPTACAKPIPRCRLRPFPGSKWKWNARTSQPVWSRPTYIASHRTDTVTYRLRVQCQPRFQSYILRVEKFVQFPCVTNVNPRFARHLSGVGRLVNYCTARACIKCWCIFFHHFDGHGRPSL